MNDIKISLDTIGDDNEITLVRVDGVIDTMTATELEKVISSLLEQKRFNIIIDLAGVDYISSAGWGIFISNIREIRQQSGDIKLARMIANVYEIFELLEFDSILKAFDNLEDAKADFANPPAFKTSSDSGDSSPSDEEGESERKGSDSDESEFKGAAGAQDSQEISSPTMEMSFDDKIKNIIKNDPFLSIGDIKRELHSDTYGEDTVGWWGVFKWLLENNMTSRKSRYRNSQEW
ncbi:MAG: anti-sigma factor antagonist [candidate division Zixibacteria bacterium]|nr:anti-sigma factor antagonist [candidate division Zixibacteria bacterium]